jgi:anti-anti-sigma factor
MPSPDDSVGFPLRGRDPGPATIRIEMQSEADSLRIMLDGELDMATVDSFRTFLNDLHYEPGVHVVFDIGALTFMDSSGLNAIMEALRKLRLIGGDMAIVKPTPAVQRLLDISGLANVDGLTVACSGAGPLAAS